MPTVGETRRYRILGLLGAGGFGKVYHARLEGPDGFAKEVAIKLLHEEDQVPEKELKRFRDEARILGLLRDRAIVNVDPPTRLDGRWAVIMEYVDGASVEALLRHGPLPSSVALEVVGEVARALHKAWEQPGADGRPFHLLHRDIKPGNIQITASGEVKILDFGVARAEFSKREARTTRHIGGTIGYIAPERLSGQESPAGDIFSLGVFLEQLVTGSGPLDNAIAPSLADGEEVLELARHMAQGDPQHLRIPHISTLICPPVA